MKKLICFLLIIFPTFAPAATDSEIAAQFYPQALIEEYQNWNETIYPAPTLHQEVRADLDRSGSEPCADAPGYGLCVALVDAAG
jgi:hypothetical protein